MKRLFVSLVIPGLIVLALVLLTAIIPGLPWWGSCVPVLLFGFISKKNSRQMPGFTIGF